ncbi:hypothetical protein ACH5RR_036965 [Cinchona calisaya]|uniref:Uncharacterized protein n=1 Tax=Cinchona calisaya TaxID=153742 RepID=A0ABD2Y662_9GENT
MNLGSEAVEENLNPIPNPSLAAAIMSEPVDRNVTKIVMHEEKVDKCSHAIDGAPQDKSNPKWVDAPRKNTQLRDYTQQLSSLHFESDNPSDLPDKHKKSITELLSDHSKLEEFRLLYVKLLHDDWNIHVLATFVQKILKISKRRRQSQKRLISTAIDPVIESLLDNDQLIILHSLDVNHGSVNDTGKALIPVHGNSNDCSPPLHENSPQ